MKALSIRQPWADLILQGRKTMELRTWAVAYRGPLAIHAARTVEREACVAHGVDPDRATTGAVIGVADLVEIEVLDVGSYHARRAEHLADEPFPAAEGSEPARPLYGWRLANPRPLREPLPMQGRMGLFEAPVADPGPAVSIAATVPPPPRGAVGTVAAPRRGAERAPVEERSLHPFELRVVPEAGPGEGQPPYRLALHQRAVAAPRGGATLYGQPPPLMDRVVELGGPALRAVAGEVIEALRQSGYKPTDLSATRREPFALSEESGVRLGLLFLAVRPLTKVERMDVIAQGIRAMTSEEAYYWYAKCAAGPAAERAQRALRVLLAEE